MKTQKYIIEFRRKSALRLAKYSKIYGPEFVREYTGSGVRMEKVKWIVFQKKLGRTIRYSTVIRIELLNQICGLPLLNVGWRCARCKRSCKDPLFFDIDHVIPVADGGGNSAANRQCLCPNCHRIKSLGLNGVSIHHDFRDSGIINCDSTTKDRGLYSRSICRTHRGPVGERVA
jgi:hypothetical protein